MTAGLHYWREAASGGMTVARDAGAVFRAAIRAGLLSERPEDDNWAGHYFYMFHDADGAARFKHRDTRVYVAMPVSRGGTRSHVTMPAHRAGGSI